MAGAASKSLFGLQVIRTIDTEVRVLIEPRTVPYDRIVWRLHIRTVSVPYRPYSLVTQVGNNVGDERFT